MNSIKIRLKNSVKTLAASHNKSKNELLDMVQNGTLSGTFSQVKFSDAAAAESALSAISFSEDFVDDKIDGNSLENSTDEQIKEACEDILESIQSQIQNTIGLKIDATKCHYLDGLNRALKEIKKVLL